MTRKYYKKSLKFKALERITQMNTHVILREDIQDMGSARQISRCFQDLQEIGVLAKIGYGVYVKAYMTDYLDNPLKVIKGGFGRACKEALTRLGVNWEPGSAEQAYNSGLSTQVPVRTIVRLKSRFRRRLAYGGKALMIEKKINAR